MTAEPTIPFPTSPYCRVRARVASIWADGPDDGTHPDWRPAAGEKVTLTPSIGSQLLTYDVAGPEPIIVTVERVECVVDEDGWLAKSDGRPVFIAPTDDPLLSATGWTWTASIKGKSVPFSATSGGVVDLAVFIAAPATDDTKLWVERIPELIDAAGNLVSIESVTRDGDDLVVTLTNGSTTRFPLPGGGSGGVTAHGALTGLAEDDHPQYLTPARGDARYAALGAVSGAPRAMAWAFMALASCETIPNSCRILFLGDSLTEGRQWPTYLVRRLTEWRLPGVTPLAVPSSTLVADVAPPTSGIYGFNCAVASRGSADYVTTTNAVAIAQALQPQIIFHGIGTNDKLVGLAPAAFKSNIESAITSIEAVLTRPCVHIFNMFSTPVQNNDDPYEVDEYVAAMIEVAQENPSKVVAIDFGPYADTLGINIITPDPYNLGGQDRLHIQSLAYRLWGEMLFRALTAAAPAINVLGWSGAVLEPTPDTTAPTVPTELSATAVGPTSVNLAWTASTDNIGVTGYEYRIGGGAAINAGADNAETVTGLTEGTLYSFEVRAYDAAGNRSGWSTAATVTTPTVDTTAPIVGTMAASGIASSTFTLTVSGASDAGGLHATPYAFTTNGGTTWSAYQSSPVYVASGLTPSTGYSCNWKVRDWAGNESIGTAQTVTTGAPVPLSVSYVASPPLDASITSTTRSFSGVSLGEPAADRQVIIAVVTAGSSFIDVTGVTVAGVTATLDARADSRLASAIFRATVPTGTVGDVVVTTSAPAAGTSIGVYRATGDLSVVDTAALKGYSTSLAASVDTAPGGYVIGVAGTTTEAEWETGGLVSRYAYVDAGRHHSSASRATDSTETISVQPDTSTANGAYSSHTLVSYA